MKQERYEAETIILYNEVEQTASVYTHDPKLKEKLKRLSEKHPERIIFITDNENGGVTYVVPKKCVQIREPVSEERRKAASERAKTAGYHPPKRGKVDES